MRRIHTTNPGRWLLALAIATVASTGGQIWAAADRDTVHGCGYIDYGDYEPKEPRSLGGFPKVIRSKLIAHLKSRLGEAGYGRLRYAGGQIVDFGKLYEVEPDAKDYEWVVPAYLVHFAIKFGSDPDESYCAEIALDSAGNILDELAFPRIVDDPGTLSIVSKQKALEVAAMHDVPIAKAWTELAYAPRCDCLEWLVGYKVEEKMSTFRELILHLNAVDPTKYRWSEQVGDY